MNIKKEIFGYIKLIAAGIIVGLLLNKFVIMNANIISESMYPTLAKGERLIGLRTAYLFSEPRRGDIIVFKFPDDESQLFTKRIIGIPGDIVEIKDGKVYLNGSKLPLEEDYVKVDAVGDFGPYIVEKDCYFVLGDNRNNSKDSRYWNNTFVKRNQILCKLGLRYKGGFGFVE